MGKRYQVVDGKERENIAPKKARGPDLDQCLKEPEGGKEQHTRTELLRQKKYKKCYIF
jgi:hypothetical protein